MIFQQHSADDVFVDVEISATTCHLLAAYYLLVVMSTTTRMGTNSKIDAYIAEAVISY
jgi:hypothetical protein